MFFLNNQCLALRGSSHLLYNNSNRPKTIQIRHIWDTFDVKLIMMILNFISPFAYFCNRVVYNARLCVPNNATRWNIYVATFHAVNSLNFKLRIVINYSGRMLTFYNRYCLCSIFLLPRVPRQFHSLKF